MQRVCLKCKNNFPATNDFFYKDKNRALGLMYVCKSCDKKRTQKQDRTNRYRLMTETQKKNKVQKAKIYSKTVKGKAIHLLNAYRKADLKKRLEFSLTKEDLIFALTSNCVYCGFSATGFDRIKNDLGHIRSNCVPSCKECNVARMDNFTHEETFLIGETIKMIKNKRLQNGIVYPKI